MGHGLRSGVSQAVHFLPGLMCAVQCVCVLHGGSGEGESLRHYPWAWCAGLMCVYCYANYLHEQGAICLCVPASDDVVGWVVDN